MSSEIFDQASLKDPKARRFAEAFEGCDEWITLPDRRADSRVFDFQRQSSDLDLSRSRGRSWRTGIDRAA